LVQQQLEQEEKKNHEEQARLLAEKHRLECIQKEEAEILEARSKPLRTYLMETVLPALTEGMLEIIKVQPKDPVDYLAEFLFRKGKEM
jgi:adenylate kinase